MSKFTSWLAMYALFITIAACKKEDSPPAMTSAIEGNWKYESNIGAACNDLIGTTWKVSGGTATATFVPPNNGFGWKTGDNVLANIAQTTSPNNFTANGYSKAGGVVADPNIKVNIIVATGAQSMTVTYTNVCNPAQRWVKN